MNDKTAATGGTPGSDFDLDAFLRENNFLVEDNEDKNVDGVRSAKKSKDKGLTKSGRAKKRSNSTADADSYSPTGIDGSTEAAAGGFGIARGGAATGGTATGDADAGDAGAGDAGAVGGGFDPDATMSYAAVGAELPEIPLVKDTEQEVDSKAKRRKARAAKDAAEGIAAEGDPFEPSSRKIENGNPVSLAVAGTAGAAGTTGAATGAATGIATGASGGAGAMSGVDAISDGSGLAQPGAQAAGLTSPVAAGPTQNFKPKSRSAAVRKTRSGAAAAARRQARGGGKGPNARRRSELMTLANPEDFHNAEITDNSYRIRGGGTMHIRRSPLIVILIAVVIIAGIGLLGWGGKYAFEAIQRAGEKEIAVYLTEEQTRPAIDAEMPVITDYIWSDPNAVLGSFTEWGWNVRMNERAVLSGGGTGMEIIHLAPGVSEDVLQGYYESEFNAYDFDELQESFNGCWVLDLLPGGEGQYGQLKYVNFASKSLADELAYLREKQGLVGEGTVVDAESIDEFGNNYAQGYTTIGETVYYWKVIGIAFKEYYRGQDRRDLPDTSIFVKCTVATYDFYGVNDDEQDGGAGGAGGGAGSGGGNAADTGAGGTDTSGDASSEDGAADENATTEQ